ncbi:RNA-directed DNA polymerase, eukaryota, reverse transcriptase zinc-binding domain protein [Tanacetum coccineum]
MFGDMNAVKNEQERVGYIFNNTKADHFNSFIDATSLVDLPLGWRSFTWMNKVVTKLSKLDRFLILKNVIDLLLDIRITALDRIWSDHNPILHHVEKIDFGPSSFKLYISRLLRDGFDDIIKSEWELLDSNNTGFLIKCHDKFRILKSKIRQWNNNNKSLDRNRKIEAIEELSSIEKKIDTGSATHSDTENRLKLLHELKDIDKFALMDLIQKARVKWDIEGDENSKLFHGLINQKWQNQMINGIMDSQVLFPNLPHSHTLNTMDQDYLDRLVTLEEIKEAVWDCGSSKAPGPDGFSFAFVKKYCYIIQKDMFDFVNSFFVSSEVPHGASSSFFTLIPKVNNPTFIIDFCPISLIGTHYKIIAKIIANRLAKVIDKIVRKEQSAFIAGRQILDGPIILTSILVNGSPTSEFFINHSLRQRDPLSHFLFILVMEGLHNAFTEAMSNGLISGININNSTINISYLFFVDDVIITTGWNARDLENIIRVLHVFYLASGLKINILKSNIYGIVNEEVVYNMTSNAGCTAGNIPFDYLGLFIGSNMKSTTSWKVIVDRFRSRLSTWKANLLSIGGRLTLIKSVLGSLSIYYLLIFRTPELVLNDLERIQTNFFGEVVKAFHGHKGGFDNNGCSFEGIWANIVGSSNFLHLKGEAPLFIRHNRLYRLYQDKDCLIIDRIINGQWHWNWSRTNLGARNLSSFRDMLNEIGQVNIEVSEDTCVWSLGPKGTFTVKDARNLIDQKSLPSLPSTTWEKSIPRKVNIFIWRLSLDRLPHRLNLSLRGMDILTISCSSCNANVESANHIFFECTIASDMWKLVYRWCDIPFVQALSFEAFKDWFSSWHAPKDKKHKLYVISASVLWWLWRFRNSVTFNSQPLRKSDIFDYVRSSSFSWLRNRGNLILSWTDWLKSPLMTAYLDNG